MHRITVGLALLCAFAVARADSSSLRFATIAPDGTTWAHELKAWAEEIERESAGAVRIKIYFGAIAGDEPEMAERIRRGQLDGMVGSMYCYHAAPSLRVTLVVGMFQDHDEASWVVNRLRPTLDREFLAGGFVNLGEMGLGSIIVFSRRPIASMTDLRRTRLLLWGRDDYLAKQLPLLGLKLVLAKIEDGSSAYADVRADGFLATASSALAFQWSSQARYFTDLRLSFIVGCTMVSARSFDALPLEAQRAIRTASAKLARRYEQIGRDQDDALLGKLFQKQGLERVPVDERFRSEFFEAARAAREQLSEQVASPDLLRRVLSMLADYRGARR